jgi:hypothetical protein
MVIKAVPWLRLLVAGLSLQRPVFDLGSVHVEFVVDKVALGPEYFGFPLSISFQRYSIIRKNKNKLSDSSQGCTISLKAAMRS